MHPSGELNHGFHVAGGEASPRLREQGQERGLRIAP